MAKLTWDDDSERLYELGSREGVLYVQDSSGKYGAGVAWNGLTGVSEAPEGAEETELWANDDKYGSVYSREKFKATITAYTSPEEFDACDGSLEIAPGVYAGQQTRKGFGMSWVTTVGNDTEGIDYGEKLHVMYNGKCSPSQRDMKTINDSIEAVELSWEVSTTPVAFTGVGDFENLSGKSAHFIFNSKRLTETSYQNIKDVLQGCDAVTGTNAKEAKEASLPDISTLLALAEKAA